MPICDAIDSINDEGEPQMKCLSFNDDGQCDVSVFQKQFPTLAILPVRFVSGDSESLTADWRNGVSVFVSQPQRHLPLRSRNIIDSLVKNNTRSLA
ncbi:hypothetical protein CEXT_386321 [Caerostris extrusa]|uniref:Uncharacterized protein n=1 Tax=Caerostris extrusa TaxID=172846 RepID=A0AAV4QZG8_CAEEX|nr:hypothetical protein CEXT_386321 [Caerostris extrusa]